MSSWVIGVINISWKLYKKERYIISRHNLSMQRNGGGQIGIIVQNIDTNNTSAVAMNK